MKRLLTLVIAVSYLCLSIGVTIHIHYCMGQMVGASFLEQEDNHHCDHCGMKKVSSKNGCCKDEHKVFKSSSDQLLTKTYIAKAFSLDYLPTSEVIIPQVVYLPEYHNSYSAKANAPPEMISEVPIYIRTHNLRI